MASQPPDYLSAMGGVQNLVNPSHAIEQGLMAQLAPQTLAIQNQAAMQQTRMQQIAMQRQQAFTQAASDYATNPTPSGLRQLFTFPEYAQPAKNMYDVMDEQQRRTSTTQLGSAMAMAAKGDYAGAAKIAQARYDADKAAGIDNPAMQATIDDLNSNDPARQKQATALIGAHLAGAIGPDAAAKWMEENGLSNKPVALGLDQRLVTPTGQTVVEAHPKLELANPTFPDGTTRPVFGNPYTGQFGAAAAGAAPADGSTPSAPSGAPAPAGAATGSRADRNNNPGNLRALNPKTGQPVAWVTSLPGYQGADAQGYAIFAPGTATGTTAQQALLGRYFKAGRNTVSSIVEHWAPRQSTGGDNTDAQVNNYTAYVARQLGVDPNATLPASAIPQIAAAMHQFESGATGHAGAVRVPQGSSGAQPVQPVPDGGPAAAAAQSGGGDPYSAFSAAGGGSGAAVNTKGAPPGYAWNADHTAVTPIKGGEQDLSSYPPAMIHDAAVELLTTGQMPSMGMGGAAIKKAILDERSRIMQQAGITADQLPTFRARYGADKKALENISGIASGLQASEAALKPYMDQVLSAQNNLVGLHIMGDGLPQVNAANLALWSSTGTGKTKAAITQYRDAINALQTEYAKFMSSASGMSNAPTTDSARNLAGELTDESLGPSAMKGHMAQLQREASIKMQSVLAQRTALENKLSSYLGGNHAASSPNAPAVPVQVRSIQQYNALPSGTPYLTPDGRPKVKR